MALQATEYKEKIMTKNRERKRKIIKPFDITKQCPHCDSYDIECVNVAPGGLFSYEWFCNNCDEQWNQYGEDTK